MSFVTKIPTHAPLPIRSLLARVGLLLFCYFIYVFRPAGTGAAAWRVRGRSGAVPRLYLHPHPYRHPHAHSKGRKTSHQAAAPIPVGSIISDTIHGPHCPYLVTAAANRGRVAGPGPEPRGPARPGEPSGRPGGAASGAGRPRPPSYTPPSHISPHLTILLYQVRQPGHTAQHCEPNSSLTPTSGTAYGTRLTHYTVHHHTLNSTRLIHYTVHDLYTKRYDLYTRYYAVYGSSPHTMERYGTTVQGTHTYQHMGHRNDLHNAGAEHERGHSKQCTYTTWAHYILTRARRGNTLHTVTAEQATQSQQSK